MGEMLRAQFSLEYRHGEKVHQACCPCHETTFTRLACEKCPSEAYLADEYNSVRLHSLDAYLPKISAVYFQTHRFTCKQEFQQRHHDHMMTVYTTWRSLHEDSQTSFHPILLASSVGCEIFRAHDTRMVTEHGRSLVRTSASCSYVPGSSPLAGLLPSCLSFSNTAVK